MNNKILLYGFLQENLYYLALREKYHIKTWSWFTNYRMVRCNSAFLSQCNAFFPVEATAGVLCPVLTSKGPERYGAPGAGPREGNEDWGTGASFL